MYDYIMYKIWGPWPSVFTHFSLSGPLSVVKSSGIRTASLCMHSLECIQTNQSMPKRSTFPQFGFASLMYPTRYERYVRPTRAQKTFASHVVGFHDDAFSLSGRNVCRSARVGALPSALTMRHVRAHLLPISISQWPNTPTHTHIKTHAHTCAHFANSYGSGISRVA